MFSTNNEFWLPKEIELIVLYEAIKSDFSSILSIRLASVLANNLVNDLFASLSKNLFTNISSDFDKVFPTKGISCSFFKLTQIESRRLKLTVDIAEQKKICSATQLHESALTKSDHNSFFKLKVEQFNKTTNILEGKDSYLRDDLILCSAVNARWYELLKGLYESAKEQLDMNDLNKMIDEIYYQALSDYDALEFLQLKAAIPIDLNRQISFQIIRHGALGRRDSMPLLHHVARKGNTTLLEYLIDTTDSDDRKQLRQRIKATIQSHNRRDSKHMEKLHNSLTYLKDYEDCLSIERPAKRARYS